MQQPTFQDVEGFDGFGGFGASPDGLGATVRMLGADAPLAPQQIDSGPTALRRGLAITYALAGVAGTAIGAYHGYKRNDSVGWAVAWALLGGLAPIVVIPVAYAQGIGKRKVRSRDE